MSRTTALPPGNADALKRLPEATDKSTGEESDVTRYSPRNAKASSFEQRLCARHVWRTAKHTCSQELIRRKCCAHFRRDANKAASELKQRSHYRHHEAVLAFSCHQNNICRENFCFHLTVASLLYISHRAHASLAQAIQSDRGENISANRSSTEAGPIFRQPSAQRDLSVDWLPAALNFIWWLYDDPPLVLWSCR